jgi:hypothetical protein
MPSRLLGVLALVLASSGAVSCDRGDDLSCAESCAHVFTDLACTMDPEATTEAACRNLCEAFHWSPDRLRCLVDAPLCPVDCPP